MQFEAEFQEFHESQEEMKNNKVFENNSKKSHLNFQAEIVIVINCKRRLFWVICKRCVRGNVSPLPQSFPATLNVFVVHFLFSLLSKDVENDVGRR